VAFTPDGALRWSRSLAGAFRQAPAIGSDGTIYIGGLDGNLLAISPENVVKWSVTIYGSIPGTAAIGSTGSIYSTAEFYPGSPPNDSGHTLFAISSDGTIQWSHIVSPSYLSMQFGAAPALTSEDGIVLGASPSFHFFNVALDRRGDKAAGFRPYFGA
jgi:outer membrane protein assembly factor BamB